MVLSSVTLGKSLYQLVPLFPSPTTTVSSILTKTSFSEFVQCLVQWNTDVLFRPLGLAAIQISQCP